KSIYFPLKNIGFFMSVKAECGTVVWNDDVDIAPEHLYEMFDLFNILYQTLEHRIKELLYQSSQRGQSFFGFALFFISN
ncbi:MAG: DUF2442 domain-containing protein, partial [Clostridia bacterium]|nr:DUF2442 domain-containing protein [Clostridia bacterium]